MKKLFLIAVVLVSGCDSLYGLRMPMKPAYEGSWDCVYKNISSISFSAEPGNENQLSISNLNGKYLFSVMPSYGNKMELYFMQMHAAPSCEETNESLEHMKELIKLMQQQCGYQPLSYETKMECSSNNHKQRDCQASACQPLL